MSLSKLRSRLGHHKIFWYDASLAIFSLATQKSSLILQSDPDFLNIDFLLAIFVSLSTSQDLFGKNRQTGNVRIFVSKNRTFSFISYEAFIIERNQSRSEDQKQSDKSAPRSRSSSSPLYFIIRELHSFPFESCSW